MIENKRPRALVAAALIVLAALPALAQDSTVTYLEGDPEHRFANGTSDWLDFGSFVRPGDSVVTGPNDFVELEQATGAEIRVQPGTVFTVREVETGTQRDTVLSTAVGSVRFRFNRLAGTGPEPRIGTAAVVAGVRGTEVTVYAAADGSSLFVVDSGEVEVSNAGETVILTQSQGVEVAAGAPPGEVFEVVGRAEDFSAWQLERVAAFVENPELALDALNGIREQLELYAIDAADWFSTYEELEAATADALERMRAMPLGDERDRFDREVWGPTAQQTLIAGLNYRYFALTALSLRRFSIGALYMELRTRSILQSTPQIQQFFDRYADVVSFFDETFAPYLVDRDI